MPRVTVLNDGITLETSAAISILNTLLREDVPINHRCGGKAQCGTCRIRVATGSNYLSPVNERERFKLSQIGNPDDVRLACQTYVYGDVSIEVLSRPSKNDRGDESNRQDDR